MKKLTLMVMGVLLVSGPTWAGTGPQDIARTVHNLSVSGALNAVPSTYASAPFGNTEDQICIFCHTPHGGNLDGPLWNRNSPDGTTYQFYVSDTLGATATAVTTINEQSLLCLSCHDGTIGVGDLINPSTAANPPNNSSSFIVGAPGIPGPLIGATRLDHTATTDLRDDHPISFSYTAAQGEAGSQLNLITDPGNMQLLRFYGATNTLECGTCHDPHVDYTVATGDTLYTPFLAIPNTASQMCLTCHIK